MRALDGLSGPIYVGTGCMFRRYALYDFCPPLSNEYKGMFRSTKIPAKTIVPQSEEEEPLAGGHHDLTLPKKFGNSTMFSDSVLNGRPPGSLLFPRLPIDDPTVAEAIVVISCWYEDKRKWGGRIGWIYGSTREDVVTGYRMHNHGWQFVYCITKRDAFRGTTPINLTNHLHQVLRWATGSIEIFFSRNNALLATSGIKFLQRITYINLSIYPFAFIYLVSLLLPPTTLPFHGTVYHAKPLIRGTLSSC
ncbi:Cellulose synthase-like protein D1 [Sesamum alatum]|uniref:Cellulose synthase-like protein D1 n=1 Tax=Sesamum alatum TaxID=300844 RepID=A0AAE1Y272_9LAMI|nr:Cellulose synthase-like protein D1 [Sesamum alatum]